MVNTITFEIDGIEYDCEFDVNGRFVDNGIGPYEYWGFKGNDSRVEYEFDGAKLLSVVETESGAKVTDADLLAKLEAMGQDSKELAEMDEQALIDESKENFPDND